MTEPEFRTDGPHSPELTRAAADRIAELARFCNYATMPGSGGLENPGDAYDLLGAVYTATGSLPQLCTQIAGFLDARARAGRLAGDHGADVRESIAAAFLHLGAAHGCAMNLTEALQAAQNAISGLAAKEEDHD